MSDAMAVSIDGAVEQLLNERFSCRGFLPRPVERATIERMLSIAQRTPSWCNTQPWHVHVTEGAGTERLREAVSAYASRPEYVETPDVAFPLRYEGVYKERRRDTARRLYESVDVTWGDRGASRRQTLENFSLFGAPHVAIVTTERDLGVYGAVDCGIYLGSLLLAAQALGLAAIAQAALAGVAPVLREVLDLPEHRQVLFGVSFGYEDPEHPANGFRTVRADPSEAVTFVER